MRGAVLDKDAENITILKEMFTGDGWELHDYQTPFALVTAVCDEYKGNIEILFIHIASRNDDSILVAKDLQSYYPHLLLIFYSEDNECAEEIFLANPLSFFHLPFRMNKLHEVMEKVQFLCEESESESINLISRGQTQRIRISSIRYIESDRRKMIFYTDTGSYENYMQISEIMERLPEFFVHCHRSYIVNTNKVVRYGSEGVILNSGEMVPIARSHQKEMKELLRV